MAKLVEIEDSTKHEMLQCIHGQKISLDSGHHSNLSIPNVGSYISESDDSCADVFKAASLTSDDFSMAENNSKLQPHDFENKDKSDTTDSTRDNASENIEISLQQCNYFDKGYVDCNVAMLQEHKDSINIEIKQNLLSPQIVSNEAFQTTSLENIDHLELSDGSHNPVDIAIVSSVELPAQTSDVDFPYLPSATCNENVEADTITSKRDCLEYEHIDEVSSACSSSDLIGCTPSSRNTIHLHSKDATTTRSNIVPILDYKAEKPLPENNRNADDILQDDTSKTFPYYGLDGKAVISSSDHILHCNSSDNDTPGNVCNAATVTNDKMESCKALPDGHYSIVMVGDYCAIDPTTQ